MDRYGRSSRVKVFILDISQGTSVYGISIGGV